MIERRGQRERTPPSLIALAVLLSFCSRRPSSSAVAVLRPPRPAATAASIVDLQGLRWSGFALSAGGKFSWPLPSLSGGRLRFAWGSHGLEGPADLTITFPDGSFRRMSRTFHALKGADLTEFEDVPVGPMERGNLVLTAGVKGVTIADLRIVRPDDRNDAVVIFLIDTLRRDAVGKYGSPRPTTPNLDRIFRHAWKGDHVYAAASWTLPSVASILTGLPPAFSEDQTGTPLGVPPGSSTIASDFQKAGWSTAYINANPTLNSTNGFDQGFTAFYVPPYEVASMTLPGAHLLPKIEEWIRTHQGEKFFLLIQFLDPHEPYGRPDQPVGKTPFDPAYQGTFTGQESYADLMFVRKPGPRDVEHLRALYDDEVRYTDGLIGRLWSRFDAGLRGRATLLLAADHGEEFMEHGGLMHGPALYDEVVRVPLLIREGAGRRVLTRSDKLVSLLDLRLTLAELLLNPRGQVRLPLQHDVLPPITMLTGGAARAVVVRNGSKLMFFDRLGVRGVPDARVDPGSSRLARALPAILPGFGRYDLAADPGEKSLQLPDLTTLPRDWQAIEEAIAHTRKGIELRLMGGPSSHRVYLEIEGQRESVEGFALESDDGLISTGAGIRLDSMLTAGDVDGLLMAGETTTLNLRLGPGSDCLTIPALGPQPLRAGESRTVSVTGSIPPFATADGCTTLSFWKAGGTRPALTPAERDEYRKKLRAIGYLH